jgi:hypothetical protein
VLAFLERVFDDREQRVIFLGEQLIARADKNFYLVRLRPRLIEALSQVVQIERDEIDHGPSGNAQRLPFLDDKRPAGIFRDDDTLQDGHRISF